MADVTALAVMAQELRMALPVKRQKFVEALILSGNARQAAILAGYAPRSARRTGDLLKKIPAVAEAIDAARKEIAERSAFTTEVAMRKLDEVIAHALRTENASAHARAVELQARIAGVLVDKLDARVAVGHFSIITQGLDHA